MELIFRVDIRKHLFTKRMVKHGIRLPGEVVGIPNPSAFQRHLDNAFNNKFQLLVSPELVRS